MKTRVATHHRSVELLGGVIVVVLMSSPVARVGQEPALGRGHGPGVAPEVPLYMVQGLNKMAVKETIKGGREGGVLRILLVSCLADCV